VELVEDEQSADQFGYIDRTDNLFCDEVRYE